MVNTTIIRIKCTTKLKLTRIKTHPKESFDAVIQRMMENTNGK